MNNKRERKKRKDMSLAVKFFNFDANPESKYICTWNNIPIRISFNTGKIDSKLINQTYITIAVKMCKYCTITQQDIICRVTIRNIKLYNTLKHGSLRRMHVMHSFLNNFTWRTGLLNIIFLNVSLIKMSSK